MAAPLTIVNVGYRSTNFWVLSVGRSRFLVDLGWWGMFGALEKELRRKDIPLAEITHGFATHFHGDHAGAAQDLETVEPGHAQVGDDRPDLEFALQCLFDLLRVGAGNDRDAAALEGAGHDLERRRIVVDQHQLHGNCDRTHVRRITAALPGTGE